MRRLLFLSFLTCAAGPLVAQVNIERFRRADRPNGWSAANSIDLTVRTGNVELVLVGFGLRLDHVAATTRSMILASGDLGWQHGDRFSNRGLIHLRRTFHTQSWLEPEAFVQADYDRSRALLFRAVVGAGPRAELIRGPAARLAVGTAYMLEHERLDLPAQATYHRWSNYVAASFGTGKPLHVGVTTYIQPRIDDFGDTRVLLDGTVAARAGGPASLTLTTTLRYDSRPPAGTRSLDATLQGGLAIEW